jgi:hypothetical protein
LELYVRKLDGSKRFGPRTYPHVETSSKFEVLGPRNGHVDRPRQNPSKLRLYSRVVVCEIMKTEVYYRHFSRPSPESKSGRGIHQNNRFGSGSISPFREIAVLTPHSQNRQPAHIARESGTQRPGYEPTRVLHATVPSGSGQVRKHTVNSFVFTQQCGLCQPF